MGTIKVLILGVSGMLGHTLLRKLAQQPELEVYGTTRSLKELPVLPPELGSRVIGGVDANLFEGLVRLIAETKPEVVINCIGIIKQAPAAQDPLTVITINSLLPHRLALVCKVAGIRVIHISTDCVFDGGKGNYRESDCPNPTDLYGRTKLMGEVLYPHCVTLRTSLIGHEIKNKYGLVEWFLAQEDQVRGFAKAIFSGFPTVELSRIIGDYVIPNSELAGLYHVSAEPISKCELLNLIAGQYNKKIKIEPEESFQLNRSLDSGLFRSLTGYISPSWPTLVETMYRDFQKSPGR